MDKEIGLKFLREILKSAGDNRELSDEEGMEFIAAAEAGVEDNRDDILAMVEEMRMYAAANHRRIYNEDRPLEFRFGWRCAQTNKTWSIRMDKIAKSLEDVPGEPQDIKTKKELLKGCLTSAGGRIALCHFINSKV
jgi:hypothetical protein